MISLAQSFFEQVVSEFSIFLAWKVIALPASVVLADFFASHRDD